jgi:hypothetical protein
LLSSVFHPRGSAQLRAGQNADAIVDLCLSKQIKTQNLDGVQPNESGAADLNPPGGDEQIASDASWLKYDMSITITEDGGVVVHKPLIGASTTQLKAVQLDATASLGAVANATGASRPSTSGPVPDVVQRIHRPTFHLELSGYILRVDKSIPTPALKSFGGSPVVLLNQVVDDQQPMSISGVPIWMKRFQLTYLLPQGYAGYTRPSNPALGIPAASENGGGTR